MAVFTLDLGRQVDMLTKSELEEALAADAQLRAVIAGVKSTSVFYNSQQTASATIFTTPPQMGPAAGRVWSVMNIGLELQASVQVRVYKGVVPPAQFSPTGFGRVVGFMTAAFTPFLTYSKGQLILNTGDQLSFVTPSTGTPILSMYLTAIEIPAERIGELLI